MSTPDTPPFVKMHDFLLWLIRHTQQFPKNLRQSYTLKRELMAFLCLNISATPPMPAPASTAEFRFAIS